MTRFLAFVLVLVALPAAATLPQRDTFDRALLGSNWTSITDQCASCTITLNALASSVASTDALCFWNADVPSSAVTYACGKLAGSASGTAGSCVATDDGTGGEGVCCQTLGAIGWEMAVYQAGVVVSVPAMGSTPVFAAGNYVGIQRTSATTYRCYRSTDGFSWVGLGAGDTTIVATPALPAPGRLGAIVNGLGFSLDQWEGGNGTLPTATPCGSVTTTTATTSSTTSTTATTTTSSTTATTSTSTSSTTTPTSPTTSTTASTTSSSTTTTTSTTHTTTTTVTTSTTHTTTTTTMPPPAPPTSFTGQVLSCRSVRFSWVNNPDPLVRQTCVGPQGCNNLATALCVLVPGTNITAPQNYQTPNKTVSYSACSINSAGQKSANTGPVMLTTPNCAPSQCGDVNGDGLINIQDALIVGEFADGVLACGADGFLRPDHCDVNHDGLCNRTDASLIQVCAGGGNCAFTCGNFACPTTTTTLPNFAAATGPDANLTIRDAHIGTIWYERDRLRTGPVDFDQLEKYGSGPGTWVWCDDCFATNPATGPGGPGAHCFRDASQWNCTASAGSPCGQSCPPNTILTGLNTDCTPICEACDLACQNGGTCVFSGNGPICICDPHFCGGLCQQMCTATTTTATTTSTSSSTVTTSTTATTSTTVVGTTTTSTTTATTTTTLAVQDSTTHVVVPFYPTGEVIQTFDNGHNTVPVCVRFQNPIGIVSATSAAIYMGRACGIGEHMFWGIYPDDDSGTVIASAGAICGGADNQVLRQTGLGSFSLTRGAMYRACACVTNTVFFGTNASYAAAKWIPNTGFASEQNIFVPSVGYAANVCTGSALPTTTGAITPDNTLRAPLILISAE